MARTSIDLPAQFSFVANIPVRITDINYGGHAGNYSNLFLLHQARSKFLKHFVYDELNFAGVGLIMSEVAIQFRNEIFYGDSLVAQVAARDFTRASFEIVYRMLVERAGQSLVAVIARTEMVCYDY